MIQIADGDLTIGLTAIKLSATALLAKKIVIVASDGIAPPNTKPIWVFGPSTTLATSLIGIPIEPGQPFSFDVELDPKGGWELSLITLISTAADQKVRFAAYA